MTDRDALLAAIRANPDDDAPRLIFADWLEENGEPERAEFIRVQVEMWRIDHDPEAWDGNLWDRLAARARQLWAMSLGWAHPLNGALEWFRRGFVEWVELSAADWIRHGDALLAAHPVTAVTLTTMPELYATQEPARMDGVIRQTLRLDGECVFASYEPDGRWVEYEWTGHNQMGRRPSPSVDDCLKRRWPTVRTWTLPDHTVVIDEAAEFTYDQWQETTARLGLR